MRLAYFLGCYPAASETFIAREIAGLRERGHEIDIFSLFAPDDSVPPGVEFGWKSHWERLRHHFFPLREERKLAHEWKKHLAVGNYHLAIAHFASLPSTIALRTALRLPLVISMHARDIYVEADAMPEKMLKAAAVICCTKAAEQHLREKYPQQADKISTIYHGLPARWLQEMPREHIYMSNEPLRLLAVGRMVEKKGYAILLQAIKRCEFPISLQLIGDGPLRKSLTTLRDNLNLTNIVDMPGWLNESELLSAYRTADLFCCPSIIAPDGDSDGLPNVLVEAMSCGLPAVASNISGIPEAIEHEVNGLLVPPGNIDALTAAIARGLNYPVMHRFREKAAEKVRNNFDGEVWLNKLEELFQQHAKKK